MAPRPPRGAARKTGGGAARDEAAVAGHGLILPDPAVPLAGRCWVDGARGPAGAGSPSRQRVENQGSKVLSQRVSGVGTVTRDAARALSPDDGTHQDVVLDQFVLVCRARGERCEPASQLGGRQFTQSRYRLEIEAVRIGLRVAEHHPTWRGRTSRRRGPLRARRLSTSAPVTPRSWPWSSDGAHRRKNRRPTVTPSFVVVRFTPLTGRCPWAKWVALVGEVQRRRGHALSGRKGRTRASPI